MLKTPYVEILLTYSRLLIVSSVNTDKKKIGDRGFVGVLEEVAGIVEKKKLLNILGNRRAREACELAGAKIASSHPHEVSSRGGRRFSRSKGKICVFVPSLYYCPEKTEQETTRSSLPFLEAAINLILGISQLSPSLLSAVEEISHEQNEILANSP